MAIANFLKRNFVSILFPVSSISLIYLDWSYTRKWKEQQKLQK